MKRMEQVRVPDKKEVLRKIFFSGTAKEVRKALNEYLGDKVDSGSFTDIQEYVFEDGTIATVDYGLRMAKFSNNDTEISIKIQLEKNSECWEENWESLNYSVKEKILEQIR